MKNRFRVPTLNTFMSTGDWDHWGTRGESGYCPRSLFLPYESDAGSWMLETHSHSSLFTPHPSHGKLKLAGPELTIQHIATGIANAFVDIEPGEFNIFRLVVIPHGFFTHQVGAEIFFVAI